MDTEPTMADVWLTLSHSERQNVANVMGVDLPVLALTKISSVIKPLVNQRVFMNCHFDKEVAVTGDMCSITNCNFQETVNLYGNNHSFTNNYIQTPNGNGINIATASPVTFGGTNTLTGNGGVVFTEFKMKSYLHTLWPSLLGFGFTLIALAAILALRLHIIEF